MAHEQSKIKLRLVDILDQPIKNLIVEIKTAEKVWHKGITNSYGIVEFTAHRGHDLIVHVEHWVHKDMKPVAKFFSGLETMAIKLVSPKVKHTVPTKAKVNGHPSNYLRGTYKVKAGDTLSKIAKAYGVSVDYLVHLNHIQNINAISEGQALIVPPVHQRSKQPQRRAAAPHAPAHSAPTPEAAPVTTRGAVPTPQQQTNPDGEAVTRLPAAQPAVIFPLRVRPLNEAGGSFSDQTWTKGYAENTACFGRGRTGTTRKHAARDLYAKDLTEVVAIAAGVVLEVAFFYESTYQITMLHLTSDGRQFIVRYGEVSLHSILVKKDDVVEQGQLLAKTGILISSKTGKPIIVTGGKNISMLHFELYSGAESLDLTKSLSQKGVGLYGRRADLIDSLAILQEGYFNTFRDGAPSLEVQAGERIPVAQLHLSELGETFVKDYEKLRLDYYEDAFGYCTVGWGHLTGGETSCSSQSIAIGDDISKDDAQKLFKKDQVRHENLVRFAIKVALYQHEYDALVSLAYNVGDIKLKAPSLCRKINAGDHTSGAAEFLDITNGGLKGLVIRRKQENAMFLTANYDSTH